MTHATNSSVTIVQSGYLNQKEGSFFNRWKKYWFVLTQDGKLFKFKKQTEKFTLNWSDTSHQPIQEYSLLENQKCEIQNAKNICGKNLSMALTSFNTKTNASTLLMLIADSQLEYEEWFAAFHKMIHSHDHLNSQQDESTLAVDKENEQMNSLLNAILDASVISDAMGTILAVNESMTSVFGYTREEMIGQNVKILMPTHLARIHDEYLQRYLRRRDKRLIGKSRNVLGKTSNGVTFPVEISLGEMSNTSMENMKPAYIAVFRSKNHHLEEEDAEQQQQKDSTMHKSWTVAAFQDDDPSNDNNDDNSESSQGRRGSQSSTSNIDDQTYLDYDDPDVPYQSRMHQQESSWLNQRTSLNLQYGHLVTTNNNNVRHNYGQEAHSPLSTSPSSNTSSTSSVTSNEDISSVDPFQSSSSVTSNMIMKNLQMTDFSNYELQKNLTKIRLSKKRMKQQGDDLKSTMNEIFNSEFSSLRVKLMLMEHQIQTLEEENQVLQKQMDSQYESLMMKEIEFGILDDDGFSDEYYYWKKLIKDSVLFQELKRIAKEERQLSLIQFLGRSFKYEDTFSVKTAVATSARNSSNNNGGEDLRKTSGQNQQRFMRSEAETICEKFFGIKSMDDQLQSNHTNHTTSATLDHQQISSMMVHSQSMSIIDDELEKKDLVGGKSTRKQSTIPVAPIMLSTDCEDMLKSHLLFPTPQMFHMANMEVMERLRRKTLEQFTIQTI